MSHDSEHKGGGPTFGDWMGWIGMTIISILFILFLAGLVVGLWSWVLSPTPRPIVVVEGLTNQTYRFDDYPETKEGRCFTAKLDGDFAYYPMGGEIVIYLPDGRPPIKESPGANNPLGEVVNPHHKPYKFCKVDPSPAWGVDVWNKNIAP
jgi:hypothetical protein